MPSLRELLKSQPSYDELVTALREWTRELVLCKPVSEHGRVEEILIKETLPTFWPLAKDDEELQILLIEALASPAGVESLLYGREKLECLEALNGVLQRPQLNPLAAWKALSKLQGPAQSQSIETNLCRKAHIIWSDFLRCIARGNLVGKVAEALSKQAVDVTTTISWMGDRRKYATYLAKQCLDSLEQGSLENHAYTHLGQYFEGAVQLGECNEVTAILLEQGIAKTHVLPKVILLFQHCPSSEIQRQLHLSTIRYIQNKYLTSLVDRCSIGSLDRDIDRIGAAATLLADVCGLDGVDICSGVLSMHPNMFSLSTRRALLVACPKERLRSVADKLLDVWSRAFIIKTMSILDHEALTETLLVIGSHLSFEDLAAMSKGRALTEGISNHLESTSDRIRFLGMILAESISAQVIKDVKKRLTFGVSDTETVEAQWWRALIELEDKRRELSSLDAGFVELPLASSSADSSAQVEIGLTISELVEMDDSSDDDEFPTMRVPDSDDEDSDEDPTLIDREKLRPPVYIRDLMKMINNHDSYKHVSLALKTAPSLIRRKANFGTEVSDFAINLVRIFAGLRDNFDMDDFQELRQEALKALVVACPTITCPYLATTFFTGDYSLQQRVIILSAIALGSRELAGVDEMPARFQNLTVSKNLPAQILHRYESIDSMSASMQAQILEPIASEALDAVSGPSALKVHKVTRKLTRPVQQMTLNKLTPIAANYILAPLLGRFAMHSGKMVVDGDAKTFYEASLLSYYLRTCALVYQAAAPSAALTRMTTEFWTLILSLRAQTDYAVIEALLLALLCIIEVNEPRRLAQDYTRPLLETQEWCQAVFTSVREDKVRMLAAGVLIRIQEVVEKHQVLMMQGASMIGNLGKGRWGIAGLK